MRNFPFPGSVGVQWTRHCGITGWNIYMVISPIQKILRILEVWNMTRGWTINWSQNIRFDHLATCGYTIAPYWGEGVLGYTISPYHHFTTVLHHFIMCICVYSLQHCTLFVSPYNHNKGKTFLLHYFTISSLDNIFITIQQFHSKVAENCDIQSRMHSVLRGRYG